MRRPDHTGGPSGRFTAADGSRFRYARWRHDAYAGQIVPCGGCPDERAVAAAVTHLLRLGYHDLYTSALSPLEQQPFLAHGFAIDQPLVLLERTSGPAPIPRPAHRTRRARRKDLARMLAIDGRAFDDFWRFDAAALVEARRATPAARRRVVRADDSAVRDAVTGAAADQGFIQRLAVDPDRRGVGIATSLLHDALGWLRRHGVASTWVNTQPDNEAALTLYRANGFVDRPGGLAVLRLPGPGDAP